MMLLAICYFTSAMPAISCHRFIVLPSSDAASRVEKAGLAALPGSSSPEQPRLGLLQLGDVPAVLAEKDAGAPHVSRVGHHELELNALPLAPASRLVHLRAQQLDRLGELCASAIAPSLSAILASRSARRAS